MGRIFFCDVTDILSLCNDVLDARRREGTGLSQFYIPSCSKNLDRFIHFAIFKTVWLFEIVAVDVIGFPLVAEGRPQPVDVPQEDGVVRLAPEDVQNRGKNILSFGLNFKQHIFVCGDTDPKMLDHRSREIGRAWLRANLEKIAHFEK